MKVPHPVFLAAMRLDGLGQALLAGQPVAVSGLALSETAAVMYAAATEIRELRAQVAALAQADAGGAQVQAERDSLLSGLRDAVQVWTQKRESNRRDGDRRSAIIYSAVVSRALDILNDQETEESAQADAGGQAQVIAWDLEATVMYVGPRPDDYPNMGALRVIPSAHAHLTRVTDGRAEFSAPHAHFAPVPAPCICGGTGRVLIDDDAEVHCPHCPGHSNVAQDTDEIARHRVGLL